MICLSAARKSCGSHLFGVGPGEADKTALVQELSKAITFFVWGPILVKFHIRTRLSESFLMMYRFWKCSQEKLHFTPAHTLRQIEAWRSAVSTTLEGRRVSSEVRLENCTQVWGVGQIWTECNSRLRKNSTSNVFWLVQTCPNLSEPVRNTVTIYAHRAVIFCSFKCSYSSVLHPILLKLHILTRLMESFPMVFGLWCCIEVKLLIPLGAHA